MFLCILFKLCTIIPSWPKKEYCVFIYTRSVFMLYQMIIQDFLVHNSRGLEVQPLQGMCVQAAHKLQVSCMVKICDYDHLKCSLGV